MPLASSLTEQFFLAPIIPSTAKVLGICSAFTSVNFPHRSVVANETFRPSKVSGPSHIRSHQSVYEANIVT